MDLLLWTRSARPGAFASLGASADYHSYDFPKGDHRRPPSFIHSLRLGARPLGFIDFGAFEDLSGSWGTLGASSDTLGGLLGALGGVLGPFRVLLGRSWGLSGGSWGGLGASWAPLRPSWGDLGMS